MNKPTTVDEYFEGLPQDVRAALFEVQTTILAEVPSAQTCISYAIPAVRYNGKVLLFYSGWKKHISMYPIPIGSPEFQARIAPYVAGKGTLKFLLNQSIPFDVIAEITRAHIEMARQSNT